MVLAFAAVLLGGPQVDSTPAAEAPPPAIAARAVVLADDRIAATSALEKLSLEGGAGSVELIADFIERWKGDTEMQRRGHSALRRLPVDAAALAEVIAKDELPARRAWAAWTAGEHRASAAAEALLGALKDSDAQVRLRAVAALGVIGDPRAVEPIQRMLVHERDPATRERAERAFQALSAPRTDPEPADTLIEKLASKDVYERLTAATALEKRGDHRAVGPVLRALEKERDLQVRKLLIGALVTMKDEIAVPDLIRIAKQDTVDVRLHAIGALALLEDSRAIDPVLEMTRDGDFSVRRYALRGITLLSPSNALPALTRGLDDAVPEVRTEAAKGIARLASKSAGDALAGRLTRGEPDPALREFLASTLGELGTPGKAEHEAPLVKLLDDDDDRVRAAAAAALGLVGSQGAVRPIERMVERERKRKDKERDQEVIRKGEEAITRIRGRKDGL